MLWWLELMGLLLEILDTDIASPLTERLVPDYFRDAVPHDVGGHSCIAADSPCSGHARCQTSPRLVAFESAHFTALRRRFLNPHVTEKGMPGKTCRLPTSK